MINNELTLSSTNCSNKCKSITINSDGSTYVTETSENVEVKSQVCEEESAVSVEHGGSIKERYVESF